MKKLIITALLLAGASSVQAGKSGSFFGGMFTGSALTHMSNAAANNNHSHGGNGCSASYVRSLERQVKNLERSLSRSSNKLEKCLRNK